MSHAVNSVGDLAGANHAKRGEIVRSSGTPCGGAFEKREKKKTLFKTTNTQ